jgi:hypothetical protein
VHVEHVAGRSGFLEGLQALRAVADGLDDDQLLAPSRCRGAVEALAGGALPWDDETAVLIGTGRLRPDAEQAAGAGPSAERLQVLG